MTSPLVSRREAVKDPTRHQMIPGLGYLAHSGPPELPAATKGEKNCAPPPGTAHGSRHVLRPPGGHSPMILSWLEGHGWSHPHGKGNRLAWSAEHLSRAGWEYVGPEPEARRARR